MVREFEMGGMDTVRASMYILVIVLPSPSP